VKPILPGALALLTIAMCNAPAACDTPQAAAPFPVVPVEEKNPHPHRAAYVCIGSGILLTGASFLIAREADQTYSDYLSETDPARISELYDHTVWLDHWSRGTLLGGQALIITGLYLRFIRHPAADKLSLLVAPNRCALVLRF
jgi:hypothetical protein